MPVRALRLLSIRLARRWLLTFIVSILTVFAASYFYFTTMHALESFDTGSCTPLTLNSSGKCVSGLQTLLNSQLALSAKLCVAALMIAVTIICLLLRAARAGSDSLLRIRCALAGLFAALIAANSAATESLIAEAHGWVTKLLCIILVALTAALLRLVTEMFPNMSGLSVFADPSSRETQSQVKAEYGS